MKYRSSVLKKSTISLAVCFTLIVLVLDVTVAPGAVNIRHVKVAKVLFSVSDDGAQDQIILKSLDWPPNAYNQYFQSHPWTESNYTRSEVATLADGFRRYYQNQNQGNVTAITSWEEQGYLVNDLFRGQISSWSITISQNYVETQANWLVILLFAAMNTVMAVTDLLIYDEMWKPVREPLP